MLTYCNRDLKNNTEGVALAANIRKANYRSSVMEQSFYFLIKYWNTLYVHWTIDGLLANRWKCRGFNAHSKLKHFFEIPSDLIETFTWEDWIFSKDAVALDYLLLICRVVTFFVTQKFMTNGRQAASVSMGLAVPRKQNGLTMTIQTIIHNLYVSFKLASLYYGFSWFFLILSKGKLTWNSYITYGAS